jgi:hypothetical protein
MCIWSIWLQDHPFPYWRLWLGVMVFNTLYSFYWDIEQDWDMPWLAAALLGGRGSSPGCHALQHPEKQGHGKHRGEGSPACCSRSGTSLLVSMSGVGFHTLAHCALPFTGVPGRPWRWLLPSLRPDALYTPRSWVRVTRQPCPTRSLA